MKPLPRNNERTRRWFFEQCGVGLGSVALANLLAAAEDPLAAKKPQFPAKAKRVIFLFMAGAPSHLEMFDYKPQLAKFNGTLPPADLLKGYRAAFINPNSTLLGPKFSLLKERGHIHSTSFAERVLATIHPSAVLRNRDPEDRERLYHYLLDDLALAYATAIHPNEASSLGTPGAMGKR